MRCAIYLKNGTKHIVVNVAVVNQARVLELLDDQDRLLAAFNEGTWVYVRTDLECACRSNPGHCTLHEVELTKQRTIRRATPSGRRARR